MAGKHEDIICPNCGYHTTRNYCAECGQPTHLHTETFWSLIVHFIGHYFHYDSKFWQTLKALWFSPGKLTVSYWNKQRARYIQPVSLYIFISVVFFLTSSLLPNESVKVKSTMPSTDSIAKSSQSQFNKIIGTSTKDTNRAKLVTNEDIIKQKELRERFIHNMPKIFFFMIPLMAFVLQLLFIKRKDLYYVNHIIYALHYHSFWFSILFISELYVFKKGEDFVMSVIFLLSAIYFIVALRNVYKISWLKSVLYSIVIAIIYCVFAVTALVLLFMTLH